MESNPFFYTKLFSDTGIYRKLFESCSFPWETIPKIEEFILKFKETKDSKLFDQIQENVFVGKDVVIADTARIVGGAIIGNNSNIGHAAFLRNGVLLGENVNVGHATEVKHSIVLSGSALAHLNYVGDSIIGCNNNISGGATLANWRFDKGDVEIEDDGDKIPTHMEKMGAVLGDDCFIGVSAVLNPGTVLGKRSLVYPLVSVKGTHLSPSTLR